MKLVAVADSELARAPKDHVRSSPFRFIDRRHIATGRIASGVEVPAARCASYAPFAVPGDDAILIGMNQAFRYPELRSAALPMTTRAAEGLERRRWTVAEIEVLTKAGVLDEHERFELIGGEIVPMAPKSLPHEILRAALNLWFVLNSPEPIRVAGCTTFRLGEDSFVEPDFIFFRKADGLANLNPSTARLAVEIADSSLGWDLGRKALIYAHFGIPELWVIDAVKEVTHVHSEPGLEGYGSIRQAPAAETVVSTAVPGLSVTLATLERF